LFVFSSKVRETLKCFNAGKVDKRVKLEYKLGLNKKRDLSLKAKVQEYVYRNSAEDFLL
jgi:hypothetical protein